MKLVGKVCSGKGDFAQWISKLSEHYRQKTGLTFFPGTLNVRLDEPYHLPPNPLRLEAGEYSGTVSVNLVPCTVFGRHAFILRTDKEEAGQGTHPLEIVEIATDISLREAYGLTDGSTVEIELNEQSSDSG
jgi:CTP-dependent riboflavin kinase